MTENTLLCPEIPQDPEIVAALLPGKEELDKERLKIIGQTEVKLFTSRQVLDCQLGTLPLLRKSQPLGTWSQMQWFGRTERRPLRTKKDL